MCVVPYDSRVVLQMPRGNLETIYPRALVLSSVRRALDRIDYKSAFIAMRKHRINLNLLHDHNPQVIYVNLWLFEELYSVAAYVCVASFQGLNSQIVRGTCTTLFAKSRNATCILKCVDYCTEPMVVPLCTL